MATSIYIYLQDRRRRPWPPSLDRLDLQLRESRRGGVLHHLVHARLGARRGPPLPLVAAPHGEHDHGEGGDGGGDVEDHRPLLLSALLDDPLREDLVPDAEPRDREEGDARDHAGEGRRELQQRGHHARRV